MRCCTVLEYFMDSLYSIGRDSAQRYEVLAYCTHDALCCMFVCMYLQLSLMSNNPIHSHV